MTEIDLSLSDEELTQQLAAQPENSEEFDGALVQALLYGKGQNPSRYAAICVRAFTLAETDERRATFQLGSVNGYRRIRETWEPSVALQMLNTAAPMIALVSDEARRRDLLKLQAYHEGIVAREAGQYERAALAQDQSAGFATDPASAQISRFCAAVERGHHALVVGDKNLIATSLEQARLAGVVLMHFDPAQLEEPYRGTLLQWQLANRPAHLLYLYFLASLTYEGQEQDTEEFLHKLPPDLVRSFAHWIMVLNACRELERGRRHAATALANRVLEIDLYPATTALAMLILARIYRGEGLHGIEKALLRGIMSLPGHGGHFVRAVAARELAMLK